MKKQILLSLILVVPLLTMTQTTYVPDDNFENWLENNGMGDGISGNDYVLTANIDTVTQLGWFNLIVSDFTGLEDFTALESFYCELCYITTIDVSNNLLLKKLSLPFAYGLTVLDVSNNTLLEELVIFHGGITSIDVSNCPNLWWFICSDNLLTSLDVSSNPNLSTLICNNNNLPSLDVSGLSNLKELECYSNNISHLDITGCTALENLISGWNNLTTIDLSTNVNLKEILCGFDSLTHLDVSSCPNLTTGSSFYGLKCFKNKLVYLNLQNGDPTGPPCEAEDNPDLTCVQVNDVAYANANFTDFDNGVYFDLNCPPVGLEEEVIEDEILKDRKLVRIVDLLGRNVNPQKKMLLLYIYDDGSVEKKVIMD